jgi:hypothetical protein
MRLVGRHPSNASVGVGDNAGAIDLARGTDAARIRPGRCRGDRPPGHGQDRVNHRVGTGVGIAQNTIP